MHLKRKLEDIDYELDYELICFDVKNRPNAMLDELNLNTSN